VKAPPAASVLWALLIFASCHKLRLVGPKEVVAMTIRLTKCLLAGALLALIAISSLVPVYAAAQTRADDPLAVNVPVPKKDRTAEDWTDLSLTGSHLKAVPPLAAETSETAQFTRELLQVKWRAGDPIDLYIIKPKGVQKPPVVLYLYSYPSETDRFRDNDYCQRITFHGFAAVGFVSALTGQRYHSRPMKEWFVSELPEALGSSVHDVQMVLNYLETRADLDLSRIGMFGEGSGGTIALLASATDARIKSVDVLDPWGDWPDWMAKSSVVPDEERPRYVTPEFLKSAAGFDPVDYLPRLKAQHLRLQHVMDDEVTPKAAKEKLEAATPKTAEIVHYQDVKSLVSHISGGRLFDWLKAQLQPPPAAPAETQKAQAGGPAPAERN
jgi:acetyl esterase/lipase